MSGGGGTGKSHLLKTLADAIVLEGNRNKTEEILQPSVVFAAPTGISAYNINGVTIHKLFGISIDEDLNQLPAEQLSVLKLQLQMCRLLVIDEISMCSNVLMAKIHHRLTQILGNNDYFGNMNVLFVGDFMQLPPVKSKFCFEELDSIHHSRHQTVSDFWLDLDLTYIELKENVRQAEDKRYGELLNRMRIGNIKDEDIALLKEKIISRVAHETDMETAMRVYRQESKINNNVMAIFPLRTQVAQFNESMLETYYADEIFEVPCLISGKQKSEYAKDIKKLLSSEEMVSLTNDDSSSESDEGDENDKGEGRPTKNLKKTSFRKMLSFFKNETPDTQQKVMDKDSLKLATGCRVMLTRNIDAKKGLMNGATGTLKAYDKASDKLIIKFDHLTEICKIKRCAEELPNSNGKMIKKQFPIVVAFAATIHKVQGLSLSHAIISMATMFTYAQAYVAFSRVTTLEGLHLLDFDEKKILVNKLALNECNRLRETQKTLSHFLRQSSQQSRRQLKPKIESGKYVSGNDDSVIKNIVSQDFLLSPFLELINPRGENCAMISVINAINTCEVLRDSLLKSPNFGVEQGLLCRILGGQSNDVTKLRRQFNELQKQSWCDAADVFYELANTWDDNSKKLMQFNKVTSFQCRCLPGRKERRVTNNTIHLTESPTFKEAVKQWQTVVSICNMCKRQLCTSAEVDILEEQKYLIFQINSQSMTTGDLNIAAISFCKKRWRLTAAVEYINQMHYVTWQLGERNKWLIVDDKYTDTKLAETLKPNIAKYRLLIFEKIDAPITPQITSRMEPPAKLLKSTFLKLNNTQKDDAISAINAVVNLLDAANGMKECILNATKPFSETQSQIVALFEGKMHNVTRLRDIIFPETFEREDLEPAEALGRIINNLDKSSRKTILQKFMEKESCKCKEGENKQCFTNCIILKRETSAHSFYDLLQSWKANFSGKCRICKSNYHVQRKIMNLSTYVVVELPTKMMSHDRIQLKNDVELQNFGTRNNYEMIAAIEFVADSDYRTWRKNGRNWIVVDGLHQETKTELSDNLLDYGILLYQQIEYSLPSFN